MLFFYHNKITSNCQYYRTENIIDYENPHCHTRVVSLKSAKDFLCPHCHSPCIVMGLFLRLLKISPIVPEKENTLNFLVTDFVAHPVEKP